MQKSLFAHRHQKTLMQKHCFALVVLALASISAWGQRLGNYYIPVATRGFANGRLKFVNDSIVELSNTPTHMSGMVVANLPYRANSASIEIETRALSATSCQSLLRYGMQHCAKPLLVLTRANGMFIDYSDSLVYVRAKDFRRPSLLYIIDGKQYSLYLGETDAYGLVKRKGKRNRRLEKRLALVKQNQAAYSMQMLRGLDAYQTVGPAAVFGVVLIKSQRPPN